MFDKGYFPKIKEDVFERGFAAAVDGLTHQISEQNKKIDGLEKELAVLRHHNRYVLLYSGLVNEYPQQVDQG